MLLRRALLGLLLLHAAGTHAGTASTDVSIELQARQGRVVGGVRVLRLSRDDHVTLRILSDVADKVHVHGYDLHGSVGPDRPLTLRFVAARTGRFAVELHHSDLQLGVLEIYPR